MAIDWDRPLQTADGTKVLDVHRMPEWAHYEYLVRLYDGTVWRCNEAGRRIEGKYGATLINDPQKHEVYVNVYWKPDGSISLGGAYTTRAEAESHGSPPAGWVREIKELEVEAPK